MRRTVWLILVFALCAFGAACLNDIDTLGYELRNKPDVQKALTGRFDRYPPLYYQMRIQRLRANSTLTPAEHDDLAVAYARLGQNDEGLKVLADKAKMPGLSADEQYRLYANRGTLLAHRWLHDGAPLNQIAEMKAAEADIAHAIRLNPGAHFGREGVQLETIRWLLAVKQGKAKGATLGDWLLERREDIKDDERLAGLIMLGGAWESPDVALAIAEGSQIHLNTSVMSLALARYQELIAKGKRSFVPKEAAEAVTYLETLVKGHPPRVAEPVAVRYKKLRQEADDWLGKRMAYVSERLARGDHPDTNPDFWREAPDAPAPKIPKRLPNTDGPWSPRQVQTTIWQCLLTALFIFLGIKLFRFLFPKKA